jgi:hypothetical protein
MTGSHTDAVRRFIFFKADKSERHHADIIFLVKSNGPKVRCYKACADQNALSTTLLRT